MNLIEHPAASLFPMMTNDRYEELRESIRENGQRHPIILFDGQILDGRNRLKACEELGLEPDTESFEGDPWAYAWDTNGQRRDLTADQRYLIWKRSTEGSAAFQSELKRKRDAANKARSEAAKGNDNAAKERENSAPTSCGQTVFQRSKSAKEDAKASNTNRGSVERMDRLDRERPDLAEKVIQGEIKPTEALRQLKREQVANKVSALPDGKYRVIYADPPWSYGNSGAINDDDNYSRVERHYPSMPLSDICAMDVPSLAADDSVLFLWVTSPLIEDGLQVAKAWGFKYKACFIWDKDRHNFGHYNSVRHEFLMICTRGSCVPDAKEKIPSIQTVARGEHSAKPDRFREIVDQLYPHGPRIELFRRGDAPANWTVWGNEADAA